MKVYALTGGIGSGKSSVRQQLEAQGLPTLDADQSARKVVEPGQLGLQQIEQHFGADLLQDGQLNRTKMRALILQNPNAKRQLEAILHPLIRADIEYQLAVLAERNTPVAIVEIPLLTETGKPDYVDKVILLDLSTETQFQRATQRGTHSADDIRNLIQLQATRPQRQAVADIIIDAEQPLDQVVSAILNAVSQ